MFRWIVKLIRDEYGVDEKNLVRDAPIEGGLGLTTEQLERVIEFISEKFAISFPDGIMDEVVDLEDLCMMAAWLRGLYKRPDFISPEMEEKCRQANPHAS